jgi:hypothetical protein
LACVFSATVLRSSLAKDAVELLQLFRPRYGNAELDDLVGSAVVDQVTLRFGLGVIAGEAVLGIDWRRHFVHHVSGAGIVISNVSVSFDGLSNSMGDFRAISHECGCHPQLDLSIIAPAELPGEAISRSK